MRWLGHVGKAPGMRAEGGNRSPGPSGSELPSAWKALSKRGAGGEGEGGRAPSGVRSGVRQTRQRQRMSSSQSAAARYNSGGEGGERRNVGQLGGDPRPEPLRWGGPQARAPKAECSFNSWTDSCRQITCTGPEVLSLVTLPHPPGRGRRRGWWTRHSGELSQTSGFQPDVFP